MLLHFSCSSKLPWSRVAYLVTGKGELLEVLFEAGSQVSRLAIIGLFALPGIAGNQQLGGYIGARRRYMQAKDGIGHYLDTVQCTADSRSHHGTRVVDIDALTYTVGTTRPAGVDQVAAYVMLFDALTQQIGVFTRTQWQEGGAKARAKRGLGRGHASLGPRQLTGIA